jgi:hypothetical protein
MSTRTTVVGQHPTPDGGPPGDRYQRKVAVFSREAFVIWHSTAKVNGRTAQEESESSGRRFEVDRLAEELCKIYGRLGWGSIEVCNLDINENELTIVMRPPAGARLDSHKGSEWWYVRASIEVIVSAILAVKASAFEVACEAINRDYCTFKVTWEAP